tara:strand:- start:930 stop:1427 length:498 start_codon:yes stop_codon:yes gene_type:complete
MPRYGKRKISFRKKPGGSKVGNAIRKARAGVKKAAQEVKRVVKKAVKPVYKQTKTTDAQGRKVTTRRYRNPITGRKRKVVKTQGGNKRVQVDKRQEGVIGKRRVVKQKVKSGDTKQKRTVNYNRKHIQKEKEIISKRGHRVKKKKYTGVPKTQRKGLKRMNMKRK